MLDLLSDSAVVSAVPWLFYGLQSKLSMRSSARPYGNLGGRVSQLGSLGSSRNGPHNRKYLLEEPLASKLNAYVETLKAKD